VSAMKRQIVALVLAVLGLCPVSSGSAQDGNADKTRPDLKLWSALKRSLTGADGEEFFRQNIKDFALPVMVGTLISSTPAERPTVLVIGLSDPSTPEITLRLKDDSGKDAHLNGPIMRGSQIRFEGAATAFTKDPFMLTIETSPKFGKPRRR
jgi:hypothetical protein